MQVAIGIILVGTPPALGEGVLDVHAVDCLVAIEIAQLGRVAIPYATIVEAVGTRKTLPGSPLATAIVEGVHGTHYLVQGGFQLGSTLAVGGIIIAGRHLGPQAESEGEDGRDR